MSKKKKYTVQEMQKEAVDFFNDGNTPEVRAYGYGAIIMLNALIEQGLIKGVEIIGD